MSVTVSVKVETICGIGSIGIGKYLGIGIDGNLDIGAARLFSSHNNNQTILMVYAAVEVVKSAAISDCSFAIVSIYAVAVI